MFRTLKIFLIIVGLGVFILPQQMLFAQTVEKCCDKISEENECCTPDKTETCHSENSSKNQQNDGCGKDCSNCQSCSVNFVLNAVSIVTQKPSQKDLFEDQLNFTYRISFFSSNFHNIWQPPKIG